MRRETDEYVVEYDLKTAVKRIGIILLLIIFSYNTISMILNDEENLVELESIFKIEEENKTGEFIPIIDNLTIQGKIKISKTGLNDNIIIENINISSDSDLEFYLATNWVGSQRILLEKHNPLVTYYEFKKHKKLDYTIHNYIVLWDVEENIPIGYAKLGILN